MKTKADNSPNDELRRNAEAKLSERKKKTAAIPQTKADTQRLVHELEVHQIELEMQNQELAQSRTEVESLLRQYTDLYDFAPVGHCTLARDSAIHKINLAGAQMLGEERVALINRRLGVFVSAGSRPTLNTFLEKVFAGEQKETCEVALRKDGAAAMWVQIEAIIEDAQREECHAVLLDITERRRAEELLKRSVSLLEATLESTADGIMVDDGSGKILAYNKQFTEMWNLPQDVVADDKRALDHALKQLKDPEAVMTKIKAYYAHPDAGSFDVLELNDGKIFELYSRPQRVDGKPIGRVWSFRNVAERKRAEYERESLIKELKTALDNVRTLGGLVPICSHCKKIRDDKGYWNQLEKYLVEHTDATLTHGLCPDCVRLYFPERAAKARL
jgi:PAS domain S-box-containing protein